LVSNRKIGWLQNLTKHALLISSAANQKNGMEQHKGWGVVLGAAALAAAGVLGYALFGTDEREDGGGKITLSSWLTNTQGGSLTSFSSPGAAGEPTMSKKKLISVWTMLVKAMEIHKYQILQVGVVLDDSEHATVR